MSDSSPDLEQIRSEMLNRKLPVLFDDLVPRSSYLLNVTLCDYLPSRDDVRPYLTPRMPTTAKPTLLPPAHHLVYLPPDAPDSMTLQDGTDPNQSPGKPFTRRMWAGGEVTFDNTDGARLALDGSRVACVERVADLAVKGQPGAEKLFVRMERLIGLCDLSESDESIRKRFAAGSGVSITEVRNIFFSRALHKDDKNKTPKPIKPQYEAQFSHTFESTSKLLFRYSALTFNTHAIHRDIKFCQEVEQYPDLIFHGPLSFTFLTTFLRHHLAEKYPKKDVAIKHIKYRNTHPLYNGQQVRLCGHKVSANEYELWEETPEGHVAVMYSATTEEKEAGIASSATCQDLVEYGLA